MQGTVHGKYLWVILWVGLVTAQLGAAEFFPVKKSPLDPGISKFEAKWFSKHLSRMNEPSLFELEKAPAVCIYRLTILPTWGNPIAIRFEKKNQNEANRLIGKRLSGAGGYDPGKLVETKEGTLSAADSKTLDSLMADLKFSSMQTDDNIGGNDGDEWILEGVSAGKYHVITRWAASSEQTKERGLERFIELARFLVDKSGLSQRPQNRGEPLLPPK
jgi:hypothetical protein